MTPSEQVEYAGLAAALGRLTMALKQTEAQLEQVASELAELKGEDKG